MADIVFEIFCQGFLKMYRFCVFAWFALFVAGGQAAADRAVAPVDPPKVEGMVTAPAPEEEAVELPAEAEGLPDYRGAQKPDLPDVPTLEEE